MTRPVISVIVPAYNEEKRIADCLRSLQNQKSSLRYEVIVVDSSTDQTRAIAAHFPVRILRERPQGRAHARNTGLAHAQADIVAFTEADCTVPPRWVQTIGDIFAANQDVVGVTGGIRFINADSLLTKLGPYQLYLGNAFYRLFFGTLTLRGTSFAIRKSVIQKAGTFSSRAAPQDDIEYGLRVGKVGTILFTDALTVHTDARRIRGRLFPYLREYLSAFVKIILLHRSGQDSWFANIRT